MAQSTMVAPAWTVGLDVGDRFTQVCVLDVQGRISERGRIATTVEALTRWAARAAARVVLEAGTHSPWMSRVLRAAGHEVLVAQARHVRLIYQGHRKSDRVDAETLARLGRLDPALLVPIEHRGVRAQQHLALVRTRDAVVRTRTLLVNQVRGTVKAWGARVPACSAPQVARQTTAIPAELQPAMGPVLTLIETLTATIRAYDHQVEQLAQQEYPETARLRQVKGVGALTALAYVLTLESPRRFQRSRQVGPYLGLCPKRAQSSQQDPELRISKTGNGLLRRLLVSSAHYILGPFGPATDLRAWGLALARGGGKRAKKRAVVAVARKLAVLLHQLWQSDAPYQPQRAR